MTSERSEQLMSALQETGLQHGPGLFGLVTEGGSTVFEGAVGVADLDSGRLAVAGDQFRIGSLTKTYTAALILQLAAGGVLRLSDTVESWLPGIVPAADQITIELLLRMRSGLPDYVPAILGDPPDLAALDRYWPPRELVPAALCLPGLLPPDSEFRYSNTDYVLLGMIVEQATGERIEAQLWQRIFQPLGLQDTYFPAVDPYLRGQHATGYLRFDAAGPYLERTVVSPSQPFTAGAIVSTAGDVATFLDGLLGGELLAPGALRLMTDCPEVIDSERTRGLGVVRFAFDGLDPAWGHTGGIPGYSTIAIRTAAGRCVVLWQNCFDAADPLDSDAPFIKAALSK